MKRKELEKVVDKYVRSIEKYCNRIPGSFAIDDIHDLRVDYKRLRAFIRLCREEAHTKHLQIPHELRDVYRAAGAVRDGQLFLAKIILFAKVQYALPEFTRCLQQQLFRDKENLVKKIENTAWNKLLRSVKAELPPVLHDAAIRGFVNRKVASVHILLLAGDGEEGLHSVRKDLKDLLHGTKIFDHDLAIPFPFPAWKNEQPVNNMAEKLGDFNDECITLSFLQSECTNNLPAGERDNIDAWKNMQEQLVARDKEKLLLQIRQIMLSPVS